MTTLPSIGMMILATLFSASGAIFLKKGSKSIRFSLKSINKNIITGGLLHTSAAILTIAAFRGGELSVLVPIAALNYVWASFLSIKYLGEKMNIYKWAGTIIIVAGIVLIGIGDIL